ncbi:MAG: type I restriction-modification enzyme R subunit C-terminal domain-containing protein [Granulosicoccus sp.]
MIGRAMRRCDDIGKTVFRIYDPVDIHASLQQVNTMKPLVKNPDISIEQLTSELTDPQQLQKALDSPGEIDGESQADAVLSQLSQKLMRVLRKAEHEAATDPKIRDTLARLHESCEVEPKSLHSHLRQLGSQGAAQFLRQHVGLLRQVSEIKAAVSTDYRPIISDHDDELAVREQSYGKCKRPEDYLDCFKYFVEHQLNQSAALAVVVKRPRDLTRAQLKEVKLLLDGEGYSGANLQSAVRQQSNQDIAASIIGHIRRAALGEALQPFEQRVAQAMDRIYNSHRQHCNQGFQRWVNTVHDV